MTGPDPATVAEFVARQRTERTECGLPATITDPAALRLISAIAIARPNRGGDNA